MSRADDVFGYNPNEKDLIEKANKALSQLLNGKQSLCAPPQKDDADATISRIIEGFRFINSELEKLKAENERLNKFCQEFVYGEDNPEYYKTMDEKIDQLKTENANLREGLEYYERNTADEKKGIIMNGEFADGGDLGVIVTNKKARQILKEVGEE